MMKQLVVLGIILLLVSTAFSATGKQRRHL